MEVAIKRVIEKAHRVKSTHKQQTRCDPTQIVMDIVERAYTRARTCIASEEPYCSDTAPYCIEHANKKDVLDYWDQKSSAASSASGEKGKTISDEVVLASLMLRESCAHVQNRNGSVIFLCRHAVKMGELDSDSAVKLMADSDL
jgi:hypothetical protein